jgi:hypothetical protein
MAIFSFLVFSFENKKIIEKAKKKPILDLQNLEDLFF